MTVELSQQNLEKYSNVKVHENSFIGIRVVPCGEGGQT
jgi:aconitase A